MVKVELFEYKTPLRKEVINYFMKDVVMNQETEIKILRTALEWYLDQFKSHPMDFALDAIKKDGGKFAQSAIDLVDGYFDADIDQPRRLNE